MVVDDGHLVAGLQQRKVLDLFGPVGVHDDEQGLSVRHEHRLLRAYEGVDVLRRLFELFDERLCRRLFGVGDDVRRDAVLSCNAANGYRAADAVHVAEAVTHDQNAGGVLNKLRQSVCLDP